MMKVFQRFLLLFTVILFASEARSQTKVISVPQQGPDTRLLKLNYPVWEKSLPFNGLSIAFNPNDLNGPNSTGFYGKSENELCFSVFNSKKTIKYDDYTNAIADLRACKFQKFRNNFMWLSLFSNNWNAWDNNEGWNHLLTNLGVAAKIAHDSGLKGLIFDTENYGTAQNLNLVFYCQQFVNKMYVQDGKRAYIRIRDRKDLNTIDDLFPMQGDVVYWKDNNDVANNVKLIKANLNVYKDSNGDYYYPLIDPKYKNDIQDIINNVEKRGQQMVAVINKNFSNAEIMFTMGPSSVKVLLNDVYGLHPSNNYLRTLSGLLVPLVKGMLEAAANTNITLIDGQEQDYYFKTNGQFAGAKRDFVNSANFYNGRAKLLYNNKMRQSIGLYPRPLSAGSAGNVRLFSQQEMSNAFKYATSISSVRYIWVYEEKESYWFIDSLKNKYPKAVPMSRFGGNDFNEYIRNIGRGIKRKTNKN